MKKGSKFNTVLRWFLTIFTVFSLIFFILLIPMMIYLQNTFIELQRENYKQALSSGVAQIDDVATSIQTASKTIYSDSSFHPLRYANPDYSSVTFSDRTRLQNMFKGFMLPLNLVSHSAIQLTHNVAILTGDIFFEGIATYYPDCFCVEDLTYDEWHELLSRNSTAFLPVCRVRSYSEEYDALIYSTKWTSSSYIYACMKMDDIRELFFPGMEQNGRYLSITTTDGELLYNDLPDTLDDYQELSQNTVTSGLTITLYIEDSVFFESMSPFYFFLEVYIVICIVTLLIGILIGSAVSSRPVTNILQVLERSKHLTLTDAELPAASGAFRPTKKLRTGFEYISTNISNADQHLGEYQTTIHTQRKILQARFLEKALNGQLSSAKETAQFHTYFPDFPESYRLVLVTLQAYTEDTTLLYSDPLLLLQNFFELEMPGVYQQQLSDSDLLLVIAESDFDFYTKTLDFTLNNINQQEPAYVIHCYASNMYQELINLPSAYSQLRDVEESCSTCSQSHIFTVEDCTTLPSTASSFAMTELMALYTAIINGNRDIALRLLHNYSERIAQAKSTTLYRSVFDLIRSILICIKLEYPAHIRTESIPVYRKSSKPSEQPSLYDALSETVGRFCDKISAGNKTGGDSLATELLHFIDTNYTDDGLCLTALEEHFKCSSTTIRKAFKTVSDMTISGYIEKKRMTRANELLAQNQLTIVEIAAQCGFANRNSFYKAYRRCYGHAPTLAPAGESLQTPNETEQNSPKNQ